MFLKKLDRYIIGKFLGTFVFSLGLILCVIVVFDLSERVGRLIERDAPIDKIIFEYYVNVIPYFANAFASLFVFISVIFFTSKMAADSEIIAIFSNGVSFNRFLRPYMIAAAIIAVVSLIANSYIIPNGTKVKNAFSQKYLWRAYNNNKFNIHVQIKPNTFIYMSSYSARSNIGYDFALEDFKGDTLVKKINASKITWRMDSARWRIHDLYIRELNGDKESYRFQKSLDTILPFSPDEFGKDPKRLKEQLTLPELNEYIDKQLMRGSSSVVEFQIEKYKKFSNAFSTFILTLIGVCIASRKTRGGMGLHLGFGLLLSFSYILFMQFSTVFATNGSMSPLLAVWIPNIIYSFIAFYVYKSAPK